MVAVSMSEPGAGTGLTDLKTKAEIKGDKIIINGNKRWCSGAGHSDGYVVYAKMSDAPAAKGIGAVFVDIDTPGAPSPVMVSFKITFIFLNSVAVRIGQKR